MILDALHVKKYLKKSSPLTKEIMLNVSVEGR
jgi:hypothetical protein